MRKESQLGLYNWSTHNEIEAPVRKPLSYVEIDDETWRDGMQGTQTTRHPNTEKRKEYLVTAARLGYIDHADIGFPGSGPKHRREIVKLIRSLEEEKVRITLSTAGRGAAIDDVRAILEIAEKTGYPLEADLFLDVSVLRANIEGWDRKEKINQLRNNISLVKNEGLPVMFVPERITAIPPDEVYEVLRMAIDLGVDRICIADTQGIATPWGVSNIFRWVFKEIGEKNKNVKFDFHEHNDLGMGIANCLVAAQEGIDRLHATVGGIGERAGNVNLEQLLVVLSAKDFRNTDVREIRKFAQMAADILRLKIPSHEPIIGEQSTGTASGIHASTYGKTQNEGLPPIYFPYDLDDIGAKALVKIGPTSGMANVMIFCKKEFGIDNITEEKAHEILNYAKERGGILSRETVKRLLERD